MRYFRILSAAFALSTASACVTSNAAKPADANLPGSTDKGADKAGSKATPAGTAAVAPGTVPGANPAQPNPNPAAAVDGPVRPSQAELLKFVKIQSSPNADFGAAEHELVGSIPNGPESGSIEEAALALGLVKSVLHPVNNGAASFEEQDLGNKPAGDRTVKNRANSLEALCKAHDVNLVDALVENPLLASHGVARQVLDAVKLEGTSPEFRAEALVALKTQLAFWTQLGQDLGSGIEDQSATANAEAGAVPPPPAVDDAAAPPPNPADLRGGDSTLSEAQSLADRGDYQGAIKKAQAVDAASPMHALALDKIREFSNLAVQDLRRKAAQAFQSAMPVTDSKRRAEFLQQAKGFLEDAIKTYPDATQLPTVRDNLRVISRDLEQLQPGAQQQGG